MVAPLFVRTVSTLGFAAERFAVFFHHLFHQGIETHAMLPAKLGMGFRGIADQDIHLRRPEIARVDLDQLLAACLIDAGLVGFPRLSI